jgi:hypothetical protein
LQQLIEAKMKGLTIKPRTAPTPSPVIDLMAAVKRSLTQETPAPKRAVAAKAKPTKAAPDRRQAALLLPLSGRRSRKGEAATEPSTSASRRRKKA